MSSSTKVLITTDIANNKLDYTNILCESLQKQKQPPEILLVSTGYSNEEKTFDHFKIINSNISVKWENNFQKFKFNNQNFGSFVNEIAEEFEPDIIHMNHYCDNLNTKAPVILTVHGDALNNIKWTSFNMHYHPYKQYIQNCLNSANKIVATTKILAKNLLASYELNKPINLIYNGVSMDFKENKKDPKTILTSSKSLLKRHNLNLLLSILQRLPEDMQIFVIGQKPGWLRLPEKLKFLGNLRHEELMPYYQKASIYLALSSWDIFNMNTFYAALSGSAILACDSPIFQEFWADSACFFEMNNQKQFSRLFNQLLEDKLLFEKVSKNCQNKALSCYSEKRMGLEYYNLYNKSLNEIPTAKPTKIPSKESSSFLKSMDLNKNEDKKIMK